MPRNCGCSGSSCGCLIAVGAGLDLSGTGNANDPYTINLSASSAYVNAGVVTDTFETPPGLASGIKIDLSTAADLNVVLNAPTTPGQELTYYINRSAASTVTFTGSAYVSMQSALPTASDTGMLVADFVTLVDPTAGALYWLGSFQEQS